MVFITINIYSFWFLLLWLHPRHPHIILYIFKWIHTKYEIYKKHFDDIMVQNASLKYFQHILLGKVTYDIVFEFAWYNAPLKVNLTRISNLG